MKIPNYESPEFMEFIRKIPIVEFHSFSKVTNVQCTDYSCCKKDFPVRLLFGIHFENQLL